MNFVKEIEEISLKNEALFSKIFGDKKQKSILQRSQDGIGYFINGNYVYRMDSDGSVAVFVEETWEDPNLEWLVNSKFDADYIYFSDKKLKFKGKWHEGTFEGNEFLRGSIFFDGFFDGEIYSSANKTFKADPDKFISGKWEDYKNGILGIDLCEEQDDYTIVDVLSVPLNWYVNIEGEKGEKLSFSVIKKIDNKSTDFTFKLYPNLEIINITWESIRQDYITNSIIAKNKSFELFGNSYFIDSVRHISVSPEQPAIKISARNIIDFSTDPALKSFLNYKNINIPIEIISSSQEGKDFVEQFKKDLPRGVFSSVLKIIKQNIEAGIIKGFYNDNYFALAPIFNNIKGNYTTNFKLSKDAEGAMDYLNKFMTYVVEESLDVDTSNIISESVIKIKNIIVKKIKNALNIDKYIGNNKINSSGVNLGNPAKKNIIQKVKRKI